MNKAVADENRARSTKAGEVKVDPKVIGERPAGRTDPNAMIVRLAEASIRANGFTPGLEISSTDSNMPMSLGIPAITLGSGGQAGRAHALDEWIDVERGPSVKGALAGLTTVMALAGAQ
jgi:di/tripeptidase